MQLTESSSQSSLNKKHLEIPCNEITIGLDNGKGDVGFVSHAHADHLTRARKKEKIIASEETIALADLKGKNTLPTGVKLHHAGHMLGAKQITIQHNGEKVVYTGDICLHSTLVNPAAEIIECDRLIIDATYADPNYKFPASEEVTQHIASWIKANSSSNIVIGCYDMGKAQEMVKILNEYCGVTPLISERAEQICKIYEKFGTSLNRIPIYSNEAESILRHPFVAIVPLRHAKKYFARKLEEAYGRKTLSAVATGWTLHYRFNVDQGFPLSDHADFYDLKRYIEQSNAKKVEFHSGNGNNLLKACNL